MGQQSWPANPNTTIAATTVTTLVTRRMRRR